MSTTLTEDERTELETLRKSNKLLTEAAAGVSLGYLMMKVKALEERQDTQGARLGTLESKVHKHEEAIPKLESSLSKAREAFRASKVGSDHQPKPAPSTGATR